jgi:superfamily II DNA or RNA helicase
MLTQLSNSGYKIKKHELSVTTLEEIKQDLTVSPFTFNDFDTKQVKFSVFMESPSKLYLPRFYGQDRFGLVSPENVKFAEPEKSNMVFNGSLRPEQQPIAQLYLDSAKKVGGGLISLKCGGGKTVLSLWIAATLQYKTIVLVHKDFLVTQWIDRIREFLPNAKIGKIQQSTVDIEGKDIVLAMVQSLSKKEYPPHTFDAFGLAIFDECHHLGAEVFHKSMRKVACKHTLGLSATPDRKDGLRKVFEWYIGPTVYTTTETNQDYIEVRRHEYTNDDPKYTRKEILRSGKPCYPRMINNICEFKPRQQYILELVVKEHALGRKILILSDRRDYLDKTLQALNQTIHETVAGLYVGGMKPHDLHESQERDIILGTFSMASEGMDIPKLNTIVLASPKSDVVQSVGRILREKADKRKFHPLVIDIIDTHPNLHFFQNQSKKRLTFYHKQNYDVKQYDMEGNVTKIEKKRRGKKKQVYQMECLIDDD